MARKIQRVPVTKVHLVLNLFLVLLHSFNNLLHFGAALPSTAHSSSTSEETFMKDFFVHLFATQQESTKVKRSKGCATCVVNVERTTMAVTCIGNGSSRGRV